MFFLKQFNHMMEKDGWCVFEEFVSDDLMNYLIGDLEKAYINCRKIQLENGVENSEFTAHHLVGQAESFMTCLAQYEQIDEYLKEYFEGKYILNSFGGNILKKGMSYANNVHRDIRTFSGEIPLMLNTLIMLDDFTEENGATWLMDKGHKYPRCPPAEVFNHHAFQVVGKAGTLVMWNSNLWHCAGENKTDNPRRSLTPEFSKPFMKQGLDYPRAIKKPDTEYLRQVLGFNALVPASLNDWYQRRENRFYKENQG